MQLGGKSVALESSGPGEKRRPVQRQVQLSRGNVRHQSRGFSGLTMGSEFIIAETVSGVMKITLNRPDVLNSFNSQMARELRATLDESRADKSVRAKSQQEQEQRSH